MPWDCDGRVLRCPLGKPLLSQGSACLPHRRVLPLVLGGHPPGKLNSASPKPCREPGAGSCPSQPWAAAPSALEGAHSSLRTQEPESWENVTINLGETLGSEQSSGGGSEQRGKVCCFVMHGSRSHVAEMLHDALPPPCQLHAGQGQSVPAPCPCFHFQQTSGNTWERAP